MQARAVILFEAVDRGSHLGIVVSASRETAAGAVAVGVIC